MTYMVLGIGHDDKCYIIGKFISFSDAETCMLFQKISKNTNDWLEVSVVEIKMVRH